jgi:hypothetical protein
MRSQIKIVDNRGIESIRAFTPNQKEKLFMKKNDEWVFRGALESIKKWGENFYYFCRNNASHVTC